MAPPTKRISRPSGNRGFRILSRRLTFPSLARRSNTTAPQPVCSSKIWATLISNVCTQTMPPDADDSTSDTSTGHVTGGGSQRQPLSSTTTRVAIEDGADVLMCPPRPRCRISGAASFNNSNTKVSFFLCNPRSLSSVPCFVVFMPSLISKRGPWSSFIPQRICGSRHSCAGCSS